jgi:hypothetical protein
MRRLMKKTPAFQSGFPCVYPEPVLGKPSFFVMRNVLSIVWNGAVFSSHRVDAEFHRLSEVPLVPMHHDIRHGADGAERRLLVGLLPPVGVAAVEYTRVHYAKRHLFLSLPYVCPEPVLVK